jgi:hypothetical protein
MNKTPDPAVPVIKRKGRCPFHFTPSPEKPGKRIVILEMEICSWNKNMTFRTDQLLITYKMISAGLTKPREKKRDKVIP